MLRWRAEAIVATTTGASRRTGPPPGGLRSESWPRSRRRAPALSRTLPYLPEVARDLAEAFAYYEALSPPAAQVSYGLGYLARQATLAPAAPSP